jgi:hypothetical protein
MGDRATSEAVLAGVAIVAGFFAVTGAWLVHNWRMGVMGMSSSNATVAWVGVCEAGLLADDFPLPERVRAEYERSVKPAPDNDENALQFVVFVDGWKSEEGRSLLKKWAVHSITSSPGGLHGDGGARGGVATGTVPDLGRARHDELRWLLWRLSQDGLKLEQRQPNVNVTGRPAGLDQFIMPRAAGRWCGTSSGGRTVGGWGCRGWCCSRARSVRW